MAELRVGTSGYSFQDWRGVFYPESIPDSQMLDYYIKYFDCVEINSTYYRILSPYSFSRMAEKTPPGFAFIVKLHRSMTHDRASMHESIDQFKASIQPLRDANKIHGLLAQFPWGFKNTKMNREHVVMLGSEFSEMDLYVEFRNASWAEHGILKFLQSNGLYYCSVDEPELPGLMPSEAHLSGDKGYVRFHGRNKQSWWRGDSSSRYNYSYMRDELLGWLKDIKKMEPQTKRIYIFFNNCHAGHAAKSAILMKKLLGLDVPDIIHQQGDLFED